MALLYNRNIYLCEDTRRFILVLISRRTHSYSYSSYTIMNLYIYLDGGTYPHTHIYLKFILVSSSRRSYKTYAYTKVLMHVLVLIYISDIPYEFTLILWNVCWYCRTYSYTKVPVSTTCLNVPRDAHLCLYQTYLILIREYP